MVGRCNATVLSDDGKSPPEDARSAVRSVHKWHDECSLVFHVDGWVLPKLVRDAEVYVWASDRERYDVEVVFGEAELPWGRLGPNVAHLDEAFRALAMLLEAADYCGGYEGRVDAGDVAFSGVLRQTERG